MVYFIFDSGFDVDDDYSKFVDSFIKFVSCNEEDDIHILKRLSNTAINLEIEIEDFEDWECKEIIKPNNNSITQKISLIFHWSMSKFNDFSI